MLIHLTEQFQESYQDRLTKRLVSKVVANTTLEKNLFFGKTLHRRKFNDNDLKVRDVVRYQDRVIPQLSDDDEIITVDQQKAVDFALDQWDKK